MAKKDLEVRGKVVKEEDDEGEVDRWVRRASWLSEQLVIDGLEELRS